MAKDFSNPKKLGFMRVLQFFFCLLYTSGLSISKAVEDVRGMARNGPMVRYMSAMNTEANSGLTRPASSRTPPHTATATMPSTGKPIPAIKKPVMAGLA